MAALNAVLLEARARRRENILLRAELSRLRLEHQCIREQHIAGRRRCDATIVRVALKRRTLPSWPAWTSPTDDLRLTLVSLE